MITLLEVNEDNLIINIITIQHENFMKENKKNPTFSLIQ